MTALAVGLVAAATLAFQILLVRVFAIEQFHHFASMAIGVAMLGGGVSGTVVVLARPGRDAAARGLAWAALLGTLALVAVPALVGLVPVDPTQLPWQPGLWPRLALVYLLLALPFGLGALTTLLALTAAPSRAAGALYGASFLGAGVGAATAIAALAATTPARALAVPAVVAGIGAVCAGAAGRSRARPWVVPALLLAVVVLVHPPWRLHLLPYKALAQAEAYPGAERTVELTSPVGWVVGVRAPALRFAPGLSLAYRGAFPSQTGIFRDAELVGAVTDWDSTTTELLDWLPAALPYALGGRHRVLVLGGAAGMDVATALAHGAVVTAVELDPGVARLAGAGLAHAFGGVGGGVRWVVGDPRAFAERTGERYDLIALGPTGGIGGVAAGVYSLSEDFLHTVESYQVLLARLAPGGILAVTSWLSLPPRGEVRVILTAAEALRRRDAAAPARGLLVVRSWGTVTTLARPSGFTDGEIAALERWADTRWLDLDWRPGLGAAESRYNFLEAPVPSDAARAAAASADAASRFAAAYPLRVAPAADARPYPHHFLGLRALRQFAARGAGNWLPVAELGYLALVATLLQSFVLAAALLLVPTLVGAHRAVGAALPPVLGYFGAIGVAYLAAELAAIQQLTLLLGHPVYAVAAVLAVLLVCSGIGSWWSDRLRPMRAIGVLGALAVLLALCALLLLALAHRAAPWPLVARVLAGALVLAPLGLLMGMPFPLGLRLLAAGDVGRTAWAWAVNGFAAVVAAPLGAIVGLEVGSGALFAAAAAGYGVAGGIMLASARGRNGERTAGNR